MSKKGKAVRKVELSKAKVERHKTRLDEERSEACPIFERTVHFSPSVMPDSLRPHGLQHARPPCPSPTPGVHSNSCPSRRDAIQPSHPLSSPSPPAPNPSQHQGLFQRVNSSHEVVKVLEFQLQHPLGGTRRVGGLLGVAGRLSGTVSPFRAEQGTSLETPSRARVVILSEAHLISDLRMSGSRSVITPL